MKGYEALQTHGATTCHGGHSSKLSFLFFLNLYLQNSPMNRTSRFETCILTIRLGARQNIRLARRPPPGRGEFRAYNLALDSCCELRSRSRRSIPFGQEREGLALKWETSIGGVIGTGNSDTSTVTASVDSYQAGVPNEECTVWDRDQP